MKSARASSHRYYSHRKRRRDNVNISCNDNLKSSCKESKYDDLKPSLNHQERIKDALMNIVLVLALIGTIFNVKSKFQQLSLMSSDSYTSRTLKTDEEYKTSLNDENVDKSNTVNDDLLYYNVNDDDSMAPILSKYKQGGPVIATLVPNNKKDIDELKRAIKTLKFLKKDDKKFPAPLLIFNEGDLSSEVERELASLTRRPIGFPVVDFTEFPVGFDPDNETTEFDVGGRLAWGYYQMIRFWVTKIWEHPALEPYEIIVRIDTDSCFYEPNPDLPYLPNEQAVYFSQYVGIEPEKKFVEGLWDKVTDWVKTKGRPANPMFWHYAEQTWNEHRSLPVFRTNFEVSRKSFMQRPDVVEFHEALTENEPFGVMRHRWGDAVTRFLLVAIFASSDTVIISRAQGYGHKELCDPEKYAWRYGLDVEKLKADIADNDEGDTLSSNIQQDEKNRVEQNEPGNGSSSYENKKAETSEEINENLEGTDPVVVLA